MPIEVDGIENFEKSNRYHPYLTNRSPTEWLQGRCPALQFSEVGRPRSTEERTLEYMSDRESGALAQ